MGESSRIHPLGLAWRAALVGLVYLFLLVLGGAVLTSLGAELPEVGDSSNILPWILLSGILIGLVLGFVASRMSVTYCRHAFVWIFLLSLNSIAVLIEGYFFVPDLISMESVPFLVTQQLFTSLGTAIVITFLFAPRRASDLKIGNSPRTWSAWLWRFAVSVSVYLLLFFVIGGLNYSLFTRPFYEQHVSGLATPELGTVLPVEIIRGILIVSSILPFILTFRTTRRRLAVVSGLILFVVGGVSPLMLQATTLPGFLLFASGLEIFFQLFPTGMVSAALLMQPMHEQTPPNDSQQQIRATDGYA